MAERNTNTWLDTPDPQVFIKNSAKFNDLMMMYRCTVREVRTKLEVLNDEFSLEYKRNPISFIKTRIKKPESIYKKLKKQIAALEKQIVEEDAAWVPMFSRSHLFVKGDRIASFTPHWAGYNDTQYINVTLK